MKQQIENIIKENLPENRKHIHRKECKNYEECGKFSLFERAFENAISQINTSLMADEVLKVVRQIIEDSIQFQKELLPSSYETGYTHALEDLLSTLSPNKENK